MMTTIAMLATDLDPNKKRDASNALDTSNEANKASKSNKGYGIHQSRIPQLFCPTVQATAIPIVQAIPADTDDEMMCGYIEEEDVDDSAPCSNGVTNPFSGPPPLRAPNDINQADKDKVYVRPGYPGIRWKISGGPKAKKLVWKKVCNGQHENGTLCTSSTQAATAYCGAHGGGYPCIEDGCKKTARCKGKPCREHNGEQCEEEGCIKNRAAGPKNFCKTHGGGYNCKEPGCVKNAIKTADGKNDLCSDHGGGRPCKTPGCPTNAQSGSRLCNKCGGGARCVGKGNLPCPKENSAQAGSGLCMKCGGGKRCKGKEGKGCKHESGLAHFPNKEGEERVLCFKCSIDDGAHPPNAPGASFEACDCFHKLEAAYEQRFKRGESSDNRVDLPHIHFDFKTNKWAGSERSNLVDKSNVRPDSFWEPNEEEKKKGIKGIVFQYHGNYWHGYPKWHKLHDPENEKYKKTVAITKLYLEAGYIVREIWACDFLKLKAFQNILSIVCEPTLEDCV